MRIFFLFPFLFIGIFAFAQDSSYQVDLLDKNLTDNANAVVRSDEMVVELSSQRHLGLKRKKVVTVLNERGKKHAMAYVAYDDSRKVKNIQAVIYDASGKELDKIKEGEFKDVSAVDGSTLYSDSRYKYYYYTPIQYPYTIELAYEVVSENTGEIPSSWSFLNDFMVSTEKSSVLINFSSPELKPALKEKNLNGIGVSKKVTANSIFYEALNIRAFREESMSPAFRQIAPQIMIRPVNFHYEGYDAIVNDWNDLGRWMYNNLLKGRDELSPARQSEAKALVQGVDDKLEKAKIIYKYVQDNTRYISVQVGIGGIQPISAIEVDRVKYGDCKGMANLTKQMLIEAGFDARLTWIGTKRIAYDYSTPNLSVDNHMICTLFKDDKVIFLDGTEKFNAFGEYADRIQGKQVMIEDKDAFILKKVPESNVEFNKELFHYNLKLENELLTGSVEKVFNGESRSSLLYYFDQLKTDKKDEFLEAYLSRGDSNRKVANITTSDLSNRDSNVTLSHDITVKNAVSTFDDSIYIDIDLDEELGSYEFKERDVDYIFNSKKYLESTTTLEIPSGYKVSQLPKDIKISSKNYDMSVSFKTETNKLIYKKLFKIKNAKIETNDFEEWNTFIGQLNNTYQEQIILTKH